MTKLRGRQAHLFEAFRSLGFISNSIPLSVQSKGQNWFLTSAVGHHFMVYEGETMKLVMVGGSDIEAEINAIASTQELTFCATGSKVSIFKRQKLIHAFECCENNSIGQTVEGLLVLGELLFCTLDNKVFIYNHKEMEYHNELGTGQDFCISSILHPATYVNKILLASADGRMQLWNFRSMTLIFEFASFKSSITCLVQSPSIDVVAIGLLDGTIILYNIRLDRELMRFQQDGKVTALSFRTGKSGDNQLVYSVDGSTIMATANMNGTVALWDLNEKSLVHILHAHDGPIHTCYFFHGLAILVTASADNSIKQWIFDSADQTPRLLKSRSGHFRPPTKVRYYGGEGENGNHSLITCGQDQTLRFFSSIRDAQNVELSQGRLEHKARKYNIDMQSLRLPQVVNFNANSAKQREWDNIITCHTGETSAKTWSFAKKRIGSHNLASKDGSIIKSVWVSSCGNFAFLGSALGGIDKYNMQSGLFRTTFEKKHTKAITSIVSDNVNMNVITGSLDKTVNIWDFNKGKVVHSISLPSSITQLEFQNESRLLAVVTDDMAIRIIDIDTCKIVRVFMGHRNRITDVSFSPDGRWLVSASLDTTIRTWDLPTGFLIDCFKVPEICSSVCMSPVGDFIATTHVNCVGVYLWSNRAMFNHVPIKKLEESDVDLEFERESVLMPSMSIGVDDNSDLESVDQQEEIKDDAIKVDSTWQDIQDDFITLSNLPKSRWQNVLNLESIKERNKPKEAPKAPEKAPFLLPTKAAPLPTFVAETDKDMPSEEPKSRILDSVLLDEAESRLVQLLKECGEEGMENGDYSPVFQHLKQLGPSAVDFEIRTLPPQLDVMDHFLRAIKQNIEKKRDFELGLTYLNVLIKEHGDLLQMTDRDLVTSVQDSIKESWSRLESKLLYGMCLVDFTMCMQ